MVVADVDIDNIARETRRVNMETFKKLWRTAPMLTGTAIFLSALAIPSIAGIWLDPRVITGAPAWLKPTKFAVSTAIYTFTLAWIFTLLPEWPRMRRAVGRMTAIVMLLELAIIDTQAWRGTTSHFNVSTPLNGMLFLVMGAAITIQTVSSIAVAVALWRHRFDDAALGWALRIGMTVTILGAFTGGLMTRPTAAQLREARITGQLPITGAHTVGAPDGGPGLPGTGWSTVHGDIRVPHFIGLHAVQALPLFVFLTRRRAAPARVRLTLAAAAAYALTFALLLTQSLRGVPLVAIS
jgi:hypothetical protein